MEFTCSVEINLPRARVIELWLNPDNYKYWMDGFEKIEHRSGERGTVGAVSKIYFKQRNNDMELREVILVNELPDVFKARYEHVHMTNTQTVRFESLEPHLTRYTSEIEYTEFHSIIPKLMSWLFSGMFKKPVQKWLNQFKAFAESQSSVH